MTMVVRGARVSSVARVARIYVVRVAWVAKVES